MTHHLPGGAVGGPASHHREHPSTTTPHVLIIGGGIGGLCLAQGLRNTGIDISLHDRSASLVTERQGYGFHINETGDTALHACLPGHLYELYRATATPPATGDFVLFTDQLRQIFRRPLPAVSAQHPQPGVGVNRQTLREILSAELDDVIRYNSEYRRFDTDTAGRVRAHFADGTVEIADLIVGADGADSAVRRQLIPGAEFDDFGRSIYGRTPLSRTLREQIPPDFLTGMARAKDERGVTLGAALVAFAERPAQATRRLAPQAKLTDSGDYLRWTLSLRDTDIAFTPRQVQGSTGPRLQAIAQSLVATWHPGLRAIIENADPSSTYPFGIFAARPVRRWVQPGVTLLGDAIHTMTPGRGEGANTALRDAALLAARLADAATGKDSMAAAIAAYEAEMLRYGFDAVENSRTPYFGAAMKLRP